MQSTNILYAYEAGTSTDGICAAFNHPLSSLSARDFSCCHPLATTFHRFFVFSSFLNLLLTVTVVTPTTRNRHVFISAIGFRSDMSMYDGLASDLELETALINSCTLSVPLLLLLLLLQLPTPMVASRFSTSALSVSSAGR